MIEWTLIAILWIGLGESALMLSVFGLFGGDGSTPRQASATMRGCKRLRPIFWLFGGLYAIPILYIGFFAGGRHARR